eukprot:jgi/Botrbrau1/3967/Bobra.0365s0040.1
MLRSISLHTFRCNIVLKSIVDSTTLSTLNGRPLFFCVRPFLITVHRNRVGGGGGERGPPSLCLLGHMRRLSFFILDPESCTRFNGSPPVIWGIRFSASLGLVPSCPSFWVHASVLRYIHGIRKDQPPQVSTPNPQGSCHQPFRATTQPRRLPTATATMKVTQS